MKPGMVDNLPVIYISYIGISCIELDLNENLLNCMHLCIRLDCDKVTFLMYILFSRDWAYFMGKSRSIVTILSHNLELMEQKFF